MGEPVSGTAAQGDGTSRYARVSVPGVLLAALTTNVEQHSHPRAYQAVIIREGVFVPGLGNAGAKRFFFPRTTLARMAPTGEGKTVNLEHSRTVADEVGILQSVKMDVDEVRMRAELILQPHRPRYTDAFGFIEGRLAAKQVPNVSIEVIDIITRPAEPGASYNGQPYDEVIVDAILDGCAILPLGACSDKQGCGIGLEAHQQFPVLAFQPLGAEPDDATNQETNDHMDNPPKGAPAGASGTPAGCGCGNAPTLAGLQAKVTELTTALEAKTSEATTLAEQVKGYEAAELQALQEAVSAAAPSGTDIKTIVGAQPTKAALTAVLAAFQAAKPKDDAKGFSAGRKTQAGARDDKDATAVAPNKDHLTAMRAKLGLAEKTKLPASMQRNTGKLLEGVEAPAQAQ